MAKKKPKNQFKENSNNGCTRYSKNLIGKPKWGLVEHLVGQKTTIFGTQNLGFLLQNAEIAKIRPNFNELYLINRLELRKK